MMADLIDRQALLNNLKEYVKQGCGDIYDALDEILIAPAVDAVEVVRCKDCFAKSTWYTDEDFGVEVCGLSGFIVVEDNDFCSYGERREDDDSI